jgi:hypothetical protein
VLTTGVRQPILHSVTDIMAAVVAADVMDMDKTEYPISRILPVRHPRRRDNNNYALINLGARARWTRGLYSKPI